MNNFPFRVGQGFDVHALVEGRALIIGGLPRFTRLNEN